MIKEVKLPELGENIEVATVVAVLVSPGDWVEKEQAVVEVETEKANVELPCPYAGVVKEVLVREGDNIKVGQIVLTVETDESAAGGEEVKPETKERRRQEEHTGMTPEPEGPESAKGSEAPGKVEERPEPEEEREPTRKEATPEERPEAVVPAAPAARRLARELGLDIAEIRGTGPGGRISTDDVKEHARKIVTSCERPVVRATFPAAGGPSQPALPDYSRWGDIERQPMSGVRRKTAESVAQSWAVVPHVTQADRADITELEELRKRWDAKAKAAGGKLTVTAILLKVVASSLRVHPQLNASLDVANQQIIYKKYIHMGVAVDTEHGLLVPVIRDVDKKNVLEIAAELSDLSARARSKKLKIEEIRGASFTVTNLGGLGTTYFSPIIAWPQGAILGVGRALNEAVWAGGEFRPRLILPLSLSYDHRMIDGAEAARFLRWIAEALEQPLKLVVEG
jgi:pyruvate dehydrogenase E2 component (dihydrolipoamide acetyltransferase)